MGLYLIGAVVMGSGECELWWPWPMDEVARKISFSVDIFCRSRLRRSFSTDASCWAASRLASLASRSLTCFSFLSRKARWLWGQPSATSARGGANRPSATRTAAPRRGAACPEDEAGDGGGVFRTYAARFWAFLLDWAGVRLSSSSLPPRAPPESSAPMSLLGPGMVPFELSLLDRAGWR